MKCKYCKKGHCSQQDGLHKKCRAFWNAEHIPKNQKKKLSVCPVCHKKFYYWQKAAKHAQEKKHWGDYRQEE